MKVPMSLDGTATGVRAETRKILTKLRRGERLEDALSAVALLDLRDPPKADASRFRPRGAARASSLPGCERLGRLLRRGRALMAGAVGVRAFLLTVFRTRAC